MRLNRLWQSLIRKLFARKTGTIRKKAPVRARGFHLHLDWLEDRLTPAGVVTGTVFDDYFANGTQAALDPGVPGVTVTAYDTTGAAVASTTTSSIASSLGTYSLSIPGATTQVRIEFSNFPSGLEEGPNGPNSNTSVQFVNSSTNPTNVSLGLVAIGGQQSVANPNVTTAYYQFGDPTDPTNPNASQPALVSYPYSASGDTTTGINLAKASQIGSVFGVAYQASTGTIFASAYTRVGAGFGPGGTGAIYEVPANGSAYGSTTPLPYIDLNAIFGADTAGANPHPSGTIFNRDTNTYAAVGKSSLGDIQLSADGKTLYVVNLANGDLYAIPVDGSPINSSTVKVYQIPEIEGAATASDSRPFALGVNDGLVYVGVVDTAQSTGNAANLAAAVYVFSPSTGTFNATPVLYFSLAFNRGLPYTGDPGFSGAWNPWEDTFSTNYYDGNSSSSRRFGSHPEPMLSDITFDNGNMILGFRDRFGDQNGRNLLNPINPADNTLYDAVAAGDILEASVTAGTWLSPTAWTIENDGSIVNYQGTTVTTTGKGNNQGPGGGRFFWDQYYPEASGGTHQNISEGSVAHIPGTGTIIGTALDPTDNINSGGTRVYNTTTGKASYSYQVYLTGNDDTTFAKSNGIGGTTIDLPGLPIEIGNRVWLDTPGNGIEEAGESGIAGVTVDLYAANGTTLLATAVTDANGDYLFSAVAGTSTASAIYGLSLQPNTQYVVKLDKASNYATGGPLAGLILSPTGAGTDPQINSKGVLVGGFSVADVTTTGPGDNDHSIDFGFTPGLSLGDTVFVDSNNDGVLDGAELGLAGVTVSLLNSSGAPVLDSSGNPITTTTDSNGKYLFTGLTQGIYEVQLSNLPAGDISSTGTIGSATGPYEPGSSVYTDAGNNTDHGTQTGTTITSTLVTLTEAGSNPDSGMGGAGTANLNVDFGVFQPLSLGDTVFVDSNNDGILDNGEAGLPGVTVTLLDGSGNPILDSSGNPITTTTDSNGKYLFSDLIPGTYEVELSNLPAGYISSTGTIGSATGPYEPGSTVYTDAGNNTDHGTQTGSTITSTVVTLTTPGSNPDSSGDANLNVDFGVFQPLSLGDTVFVDSNNDGILDNGEAGLLGVTVTLLNSSGIPLLNAAGNPITTTTDSNGKYLFSDLIPGTYEVELSNLPAGYISSTGTIGSATGPYEPGSTVYTDAENNTDHGTQTGSTITSTVVTLATPGSNPDSSGDANLNVDFGVFQPLSLGDTVFVDSNNDGVLDNGEAGLPGVTVTLLDGSGNPILDSSGNPITTATDSNGKYLFSDLIPGTYEVELSNLPAGYISSTGTNGSASGPYEPGSTVYTDAGNNTDHGTQTGSTITSTPVTLTTPGSNPDSSGNANLNVDFGVFQPLSLGDTVFVDSNNDGVLDNGEAGLPGVTVTLLNGGGIPLLNAAGNPITTTTDSNGKYLFSDLIPGTYEVELSNLPAGYISSTGTIGSATGPYEPGSTVYTDAGNNTDHGTQTGSTITSTVVTLTTPGSNPDSSGDANLNVDFGVFQPLSLGDTVFVDSNNDGILDNGETGLPGITVTLLNSSGIPLLNAAGNPITTTTDSNGKYLFSDLIPGTYEVELSNLPAGYISSTGTNGSASGPYEPGSSVYTDAGNNTDHGTQTGSTITSTPVTLTTPGSNPDSSGDANLNVDFGVFQPLTLGDTVFVDSNNDGILDNGETGLPGITVTLLNGSGVPLLNAAGNPITTTTDSNGKYLFSDLIPGTYEVELSNLPAGYVSSTGTNGSATGPYEPGSTVYTDAGNNTDHGTQTGSTITSTAVTLATPGSNPDSSGNANLNVDFGVFQPLSLGDTVFVDSNNDGVLDNGEAGLPGVTVTLLDGSGNPILDSSGNPITTTTDSNGKYLFSDLIPGTYEVELSNLPAGYISSTGTNGSASGPYEPGSSVYTDAGNNTDHGTQTGSTITSTPVTLTTPGSNPDSSGDANLNVDFGVFQPLTLGDTVFVDSNNDGILDNGEAGLPGVTVTLLNSSGIPLLNAAGNPITTTTDSNGKYLFSDLIPGTYEVELSNLPAGYISSTGTNGSASGPYEPGSTVYTDAGNNTDHGTQTGSTITSTPVTLTTPGSNPDSSGNANLNVDFGVFQPLSLGDTVFVDSNNDGVLDNGEAGLPGVTVTLLDGSGNPILDSSGNPITTTTDSNGKYLFSDLIPGTYEVELSNLPPGYISSTGTNGSASGPYEPGSTVYTDAGNNTDHGTQTSAKKITSTPVTLTTPGSNPDSSGNANLNVDFGVFQPLSLGDTVFVDSNNDGILDNGEAGLPGITVTLLNSSGIPLLNAAGNPITTTTDSNGKYLFSDLIPGTYEVELSNLPAGYVSSTGTNGSASGPYEPGSTVYTDAGNNTDHGTQTSAKTITSTPVTLTTPGSNPDSSGNANLNVDFGVFQPLSLGDTVFVDSNNDGVLDNGETGLPGITVTLLNSSGIPLLNAAGNPITTTTDSNGKYLFSDLIPGTYEVELSNLPAGYVSSTGTNGSASGPYEPGSGVYTDAGNNTDHGTQTGSTITSTPVTLTTPGSNPDSSGNANLNVDFGVFQPLTLGDTVFVDSNNDGVLANGEAGLPGVTVTLLNGSGIPVLNAAGNPITTTTDSSGKYQFTDLIPGTYEVELSNLPAGYISSTGANGSALGPYEPGSTVYTDAGNNTDHGTQTSAITITSTPVTLTAPGTNPDNGGNANLNVDLGLFEVLSIGNYIWDDANNNGVVDSGETGLPNVAVSLLTSTGAVVAQTTTNSQGYYLFTDLIPGQYQVRVDASNFAPGGALAGYISSTGTNGSASGPFEPSPLGTGSNNEDHGSTVGTLGSGGVVVGNTITLSVGGEPTGEEEASATTGITDPALDANSDATQDFGFFQPLTLGDTVFVDSNNDGVLDNGEVGLPGVTVTLLSSTGAVVATTTTGINGSYSFGDLIPGTYTVQLSNLPAGYISSTGTNGSASGPYEPGSTVYTDAGNNTDHGTQTSPTTITSTPVTLTAPGTNPDSGVGGPGTSNLNVDFGVFPTLSIGNYIWDDANNNGSVDASESGLPNVAVSLLSSTGAVVAQTTTNSQGYYLFTDLIPGQYQVRVDASNFAPGGALADYISSTGTNGSATGPFEPSPLGTGSNNQDHGTTVGTLGSGGVVVGNTITLSVGGEPTGEEESSATTGITDPAVDANSDATQDFGFFQPLTIGNEVFVDSNNDGVLDNGEVGLPGVTVTLLSSTGAVVATTTTATNGSYSFGDLIPGTYTVQLSNVPAGYISSTGTNGSASGPYEPGSTVYTDAGNNTDHGTQTSPTTITSTPVTLTAPGTNPDSGVGGPGTSNLNVDFGVFPTLSIGNYIWDDANNNGSVDAGETGLPNVAVSLLSSTGSVVAQTTTNSQGYYLFTDLIPGQYQVRVDASNFAPGGALAGYISSTGTNGSASGPFEPSTLGTGSNNEDHGTTVGTLGSGGVVVGNTITLSVGGEPTGEEESSATTGITDPAVDANSDATQDFGFFQPLTLGDEVFVDSNNDGVLDGSEIGLSGVTVTLLNASGTPLLNAAGNPITTTTDSNGKYQFTDLIPGTYEVELSNLPAGYISSTGANGSASGPYEPGSTVYTDAGNNTDHGNQTGSTITSTPVTLTVPGTNPDSSGDANLNVDFGVFQPLSLGDTVFVDSNNDGVLDNGEKGLPGVTVTLLNASGNPILNPSGQPITTTTDSNGQYLFTDLIPGTYEVELSNLPAGYISSTGTNGSASGPYEPGSTVYTDAGNNTDHGTQTSPTTITSTPVTLTAPGTNPDSGVGGPGTSNLNVDFGVFPTLSIGNYIWNDANNNGVKDAGEPGLPNVAVTLLSSTGTVVAQTTTNSQGYYLFTDLIPGQYQVRVNASNFAPGGALTGYISSTGTNGSATGAYEPSTLATGSNDKDHGTTAGILGSGGAVVGNTITLSVGGEPTGEEESSATTGITDPAVDANSDATQDFGFFQPLTLGNEVFVDSNNDGKLDNGETGLGGVTVTLLSSSGSVVATTTTTSNGSYSFGDLIPGTYTVRLSNLPAGYVSSTGTNGSASGPYDPGSTVYTDAGNNTDHGTQTSATTITSTPVTLTAPGTNPDSGVGGAGTSNLNVDFGVFPTLSIGNYIWKDANNNGVVDPGESGLPNVSVSLLSSTGSVVAQTTTNSKGYYLFTDLIPGEYRVRVNASNFAPGGALAGYTSSTGANGSATGAYEPSTLATGSNNQDHGTTSGTLGSGGVVLGNIITLSVGGEPTSEEESSATTGITDPAIDANSDATQDFGFFQPLTLGNEVYVDSNNDGKLDNGESGLGGVTVTLLSSSGSVVATTTTASNGSYSFGDLLPGTYTVQLSNLPAGYISSTGTNGSASGPYEPGSAVDTDAGNNSDHGTQTSTTTITGTPVTLTAPGTNPDSGVGGPGSSNLNVDFGVFPTLSIGNYIWDDANNNGVLDPGESGLPNVAVSLLNSTGSVVAQTTTNSQGYYLFTDLIPGQYQVRVDASNFAAGGPLARYTSSTGNKDSASGAYEPSTLATGSNNQDHGTIVGLLGSGGYVVGNLISLSVGGEPTGVEEPTATTGLVDPAAPGNTDPTQDFGFTLSTADVTVTVTPDTPTILLGQNDGVTITVTNVGPDQATSVVTSVVIPAGVTIVQVGTPSQGSYNPVTGIWTIGTLPPGETETLRLIVTTSTTGTVPVTAYASLNQVDPTLSNNSSAGPITTTPGMDESSKRDFLASTASAAGLPSIAPTQLPPAIFGSRALIATGAGPGNLPLVEVWDRATGQLLMTFLAYGSSFRGGVNVAVVDDNGVDDIITAPMSDGGPNVRVFDGTTGAQISSFFAFASTFTGGVRLAAADLGATGVPDIVVGAGVGGAPAVAVFTTNGTLLSSFYAYNSAFRSGVNVAAGVVNGVAEIVTGAGAGGGPNVKVFNPTTGAMEQSFFAYASTFRGGVTVAIGNLTGPGQPDILTGAGAGGAPQVNVFSGGTDQLFASYMAFAPSFLGGVNVAAADVNGDGRDDLIVTPASNGGPVVLSLDAVTGQQLDSFYAYAPGFLGGVNVAATDI